MAKLLFNITNGTNNPTKASLGFMLARTAVEEGHEVQVFLNADAVSLIRKPVLDSLVGLGTGKLSEHFDILVDANVPIYVSAISCEIRGVTEKDLEETNSIKVFPKTLLNLSLQSDRTFVYWLFYTQFEPSMQKILIILGIIILIIGLLYPYIKKLGFGQLPGDMIFKSGNSTFFFPIVTCVIISLILTIIINLFK